ncbi:hypothetical protein KI688_010285 [Linnemannia hyalina]|uniref:Uncharacterized protein n=1 Tax=Linnemannia hyalina TaxID=64524 RepID=A0A9P8BVL6_9FUNG|nr:hypothetical protein KI688_010285 [Linnemannia hyalina]
MAARSSSSSSTNNINNNSTAADPATNPASNPAPVSTKIDPDHVGHVGKTVDQDWTHLYKPFNISKDPTDTAKGSTVAAATNSAVVATEPTAPTAVASFLSTTGNSSSSSNSNSALSLSPGTEPRATASAGLGAVVAMNANPAVLPATLAAASSLPPTASAS